MGEVFTGDLLVHISHETRTIECIRARLAETVGVTDLRFRGLNYFVAHNSQFMFLFGGAIQPDLMCFFVFHGEQGANFHSHGHSNELARFDLGFHLGYIF